MTEVWSHWAVNAPSFLCEQCWSARLRETGLCVSMSTVNKLKKEKKLNWVIPINLFLKLCNEQMSTSGPSFCWWCAHHSAVASVPPQAAPDRGLIHLSSLLSIEASPYDWGPKESPPRGPFNNKRSQLWQQAASLNEQQFRSSRVSACACLALCCVRVHRNTAG